MKNEIIWKQCGETKNKVYYISNIGGKLKSVSKRTGKEKEVKVPKYKDYLQYNSLGYIHRLVAIAFVPNPDNLHEVDHIDGNKHNNDAMNLRWVSHKDNINNPVTLSRHIYHTNYHWYNNGEKNIRAIECPNGYVKGMLK